jgi:FAS-associated factor 2
MDNTSISPSQRAALEQLQVLTNGGDPDVAIDVLESVDWDVSVSSRIFGKI